MPISERALSRWSHHQASSAFMRLHLSIREALHDYIGPLGIKYEVLLQSSYENDTNLGRDSDVDVVVRLIQRLRPRVAKHGSKRLQEDASHHGSIQR